MSQAFLHPICIKNQDENNNILGLDTSELRFRSVQNLVLKLETRPRAEQFRSHEYLIHDQHHTHLNVFLSPANEVWGKVMFLHVCHSPHWEGVFVGFPACTTGHMTRHPAVGGLLSRGGRSASRGVCLQESLADLTELGKRVVHILL